MRCCGCAILCLAFGLGSPGRASPAEFAFEFRKGLLWVGVQVESGARPLRFLFDTGAQVSVLDLAVARELGLALGPKVRVRGVGSSHVGHWPLKLAARAGAVALPTEYLALDLSRLSRACEWTVDGLIGADFVCGRIVELDFEAQRIRLLQAPPRTGLRRTVPLQVRTSGLRVKLRVNGRPAQWVRLDTGCASALQWVTDSPPATVCADEWSVGLAEVSVPQTTTDVLFGGHRFRNVPTGVHPAPIFPGEAGLLGNGLLSRFRRVTMDTRAGKLFLGERRP